MKTQMLKPKIKVEINLVPGKLTPEAEAAWAAFWEGTIEITNRNKGAHNDS
jgi:hypothetical protein